MDASFIHDPYEVSPCSHAGKPGGCSHHATKLKDSTWRVPDSQYQMEEARPEDLEVDGIEVILGLSWKEWAYSYEGEDPDVLADWKHGSFSAASQGVNMSEDDRELVRQIVSQVDVFLYSAPLLNFLPLG